ncbi:archaeal/vacuolar-type H+-ATPase subunit E [Caldisphaera lagunensis DSM 15908]|uniref:Archaeal/vacuolar-type H+-ATPase subunit E n=1 Tax=Caldisphaera lagunensis (strain DSM 15908 / JCM 11604 / ANMR 0165 / IC-154) TaxID=1056495 RepID=L0ABW4_CALLD|nr:V-type ATP synthase subunit E family protein [Caldisphaera lagunensis]AFZ70924.1 archaeal/vacuolar-type H+-ATPase subunit E [Caldisphaera lagunensis DSM 15908]
MTLAGNPKKVAEEIKEKNFVETKKLVDDAYSASLKLLNESYQAALNEFKKGLNDKSQELNESLKSVEASLQLELRKAVSEKRNKYIDDVFNNAINEIKKEKSKDWYINFMKKVISIISSEADSYNGLIVYTSEDDKDLVKKLTSQFKNIEVSQENANIIGGVIATNKDGTIKLDFSIDQIIKENEVFLKGIASEKLFGGK